MMRLVYCACRLRGFLTSVKTRQTLKGSTLIMNRNCHGLHVAKPIRSHLSKLVCQGIPGNACSYHNQIPNLYTSKTIGIAIPTVRLVQQLERPGVDLQASDDGMNISGLWSFLVMPGTWVVDGCIGSWLKACVGL